MKLQTLQPLVVLCALLVWAGNAAAETRYISGEVKVNMRKGQGTDFGIDAILISDEKVQVIKDYSKSGYSKVRTASGMTGYVLTRLLTATPPATERLVALEAQVAELQAENTALKGSLNDSQTAIQASSSQQQALSGEKDKLQKRLSMIEETSANVVKIADENQHMRERLLVLEAEVSRLEQQNTELKTWYKGQNSGAMILGAGLIIGFILSLFRRRGGAWSSSGDRL